ncbi:MAG: acetyl-CoA carboxylase biotin carboxyl carrier protein [Candidatus Acetothermia bacterium]
MDLNLDQMKDLIELFEKSELAEISVSGNDYEVTLKKDSRHEKPVSAVDTSSRKVVKHEPEDREEVENRGETSTEEGEKEEGEFITSPIVGTFYRSPSPDEPAYVEEGDQVDEGDTVCVVEAMKVMNEVKADRSGKVKKVHPEDGDSVEYGQKLLTLIPSDEAP